MVKYTIREIISIMNHITNYFRPRIYMGKHISFNEYEQYNKVSQPHNDVPAHLDLSKNKSTSETVNGYMQFSRQENWQ